MMQFVHYPVMHNEVLSYLEPKKGNALMVDCTLGEGGHTELFLQKYESLRVIGLDRDEAIQAKAKKRLEKFGALFEAKNVCFEIGRASCRERV